MTMRSTLLTVLILSSPSAYAADWLCKEESSQRSSDSIYACGIGTSEKESDARIKAFDSAKAEFDRICSVSSDCKEGRIEAVPQRTQCEEDGFDSYKCYRLVRFDIRAQPTLVRVLAKVDAPEALPAQVTSPKIKKGMSKKALLSAFGSPEAVTDVTFLDGPKRLQVFFRGQMCQYSSLLCYVILENDLVVEYDSVKADYTDILD